MVQSVKASSRGPGFKSGLYQLLFILTDHLVLYPFAFFIFCLLVIQNEEDKYTKIKFLMINQYYN